MEQAMVYGRHVDFESLRKNDMDIEPEIVAAGWRKFFQVREVVYQNEVYDFWKNVKLVDNTIVSTVDRLSIIVTIESIEKVTECPSAGEKLTSKARWMTKFNVNEEEVNRQLYGENDPTERKTSSLVAKARVLHAILFNCILPRAGSRHLVTTLDEQCIFYLLNRQTVDLPFLIFQYMVKAMKDTNSYPYGMLLTRIFRESGVLLERGNRVKQNVKSFINSATIAKMGLKNLDKVEADSQIKARTEGEHTKKKSPTKSSRTQPSENVPMAERRKSSEEILREKKISQRGSSQVRVIEEGALKRKGETLLSEIPKQARRSPRVRTLRQQEEKKSRELSQVEDTVKSAPKATRSLVSILRADTAKKAKETESKRKLEFEKQKPQSQKTPRLIEEGKKEKVNQKKSTLTAEKASQEKATPTDVQKEKSAELSLVQVDTSQLLRKEDLRIRVIEEIQPVKKKSTSIIIKETPRRLVKVHFQPILVNNSTMHLLKDDEKSMCERLRDEGTKPYPTQMTKQKHTIFPITENTVLKIVPDIQPQYHIVRNVDKGKEKLYPEGVIDDLTPDQIAEEVRLIDEACFATKKMTGTFISHHISQEPGSSGSKSMNEPCPVGGRLTEGKYNTIRIGDFTCIIESLVKVIMRCRPLWNISSIEEILPLLGRRVRLLPTPDDLNLPKPNLPVQPPTLEIIEANVLSSDAYNTTIAFEEEQQKDDDQPTTAPDLQAEIAHLRREVREIKEMMKEILQHLRS